MKGDYQQALGYLDNYSVTMNSILDKQNPEVEQKIYEYEAKMKVYKEKVQMQILFIGLAVVFARYSFYGLVYSANKTSERLF